MAETLYPQEKKEIPWRLLVRIAVAVFAIGVITLGGLLQRQSTKRAQAFETLSDIFVVRTGLEQYFLARAAYPHTRTPSTPLGVGEAVCLDNSQEGFQFSCTHEVFVSVLPRASDGSFYTYTNVSDGYEVAFLLPVAVEALKDANRDGTLACIATSTTIDCK